MLHCRVAPIEVMMSAPNDFRAFETAEHVVSTPPPTISNARSMIPPCCEARRNLSEAWNHVMTEPNTKESQMQLMWCHNHIIYDNGTSGMHSHLSRWKLSPEQNVRKRQKSSSSVNVEGNVVSSPSITKFDQEVIRRARERKLWTVNFQLDTQRKKVFAYLWALPAWDLLFPHTLPSHEISWNSGTLRKQGWSILYPSKPKEEFVAPPIHGLLLRISNDNNWRLKKEIINFCQVMSHTREVMARKVEHCLSEWGINHVIGLAADNASSNTSKKVHASELFGLKWRLPSHALLHRHSFKEINDSSLRTRGTVKFIHDSPSRFANFKGCIDLNMENKGNVGLNCETRWNSTYIMLDVALKHWKTFEELEM